MRCQVEESEVESDVCKCGISIIGGLREIDVVVGITVLVVSMLVAEDLERPIGDHLVGIHIGRRPCSSLEHIDAELISQLPIADLVARLTHSLEDILRQLIELVIGHGGSLLGDCHRLDEARVGRELIGGELEVVHCSLGLDTVEVIHRDLHAAE